MKRMMTGVAVAFTMTAAAQDTTATDGEQGAKSFSITGYVEAFYSYDFNKPPDNKRPGFLYSYNRHNEFNVNLAYFKGNYNTNRVRANLALAVGTYMSANYAAETGVARNIFEANAGYKLNRTNNLWFDIGIMPSHIGWESALSLGAWTLTRSLAADNSPYFESGAKLTYTSNTSKWLISVMALNGWQRIQRVSGNSLMSWGSQVQYKPSGKLLINYSTFFGTDKPDSARKWRYFHDIYAVWQLSGKLGFTAGFDYGAEQKEKHSNEKSNWFTPVGILRFTPNEKWAVAVRGEYYSDEDGVIISTGTPNGFKTAGYSVNIDYMPMKNVVIRMEGRTFKSKDDIFEKEGAQVSSNSAITFLTAISF